MNQNTNQNSWLLNCFGVLVIIFVLAVLASPYFLVIRFTAVGNHIVEVSRVFIPWAVLLLLALIFNQELKWVIVNIGDLIKRTKKVGIGSSTIETQQETEGSHLSKEQLKELGESINNIQQEKDQAIQALRFYFHRTLILTIYRSQIEMLQFLANTTAPIPTKQLVVFYDAAISRIPSLKTYPFERYLGYLRDNFLINTNQNGNVSITLAGRDFLIALNELRIPLESFMA